MTTQNIADKLASIPGVKETRTIESINPKLIPTGIEAILPDDYAALVTPYGDTLELQFENRPAAQWEYDDNDLNGDPIRTNSMDEITRLIKDFITRH